MESFAFFFFFFVVNRLGYCVDTTPKCQRRVCCIILATSSCVLKTNNVSAVLVHHCQCNCILYDKDCFSIKGWDSFFYLQNVMCAFT